LAALAVALALLGSATGPGTSGAADTGAAAAAAAAGQGYWLAGAEGAVYAFGAAEELGRVGAAVRQPIAGMAATPSGEGYWLVGADGGLFGFGDARFLGSTGNKALNRPVVGMAATPTGSGYWFVAADGGIFTFGDAGFYGSTGALRLNRPVVGMAATPSGRGYWFVAADGGVFTFGDAAFYGSTGSIRLNKPIVGMAPTPTGAGYWLIASDGGVFTFGDAGFYGSTGSMRLNAPIVGLSPTPSGAGYWFVASDGGVFTFGDAAFAGSVGGTALARPVTAMAAFPATAARASTGRPRAESPVSGDPAPGPDDPDPDREVTEVPPAAPAAPPAPAPAPAPVTPAERREAFDVALIGDTGYSASQDRLLFDIRDDINASGAAFTIHVGDVWSEVDAQCREADYQRIHGVFNGFAAPFVYTPGDNEWTDCPRSSSGALADIRRIFFPTNETLGQGRMTVERQGEMPENARFSRGGAVFVTINEPGASGRGGTHRDRNIEWLNAAFDHAQATGAAGVVVAWQDNPFQPSGGRLVRTLAQRTEAFGKPVVLVHGDTHHGHVDTPLDLPNFTRVEVDGDSSSGEWMKMTVNASSPGVFSFDEQRA
jgi:ribosomal protein L24E